MKEGSCQVKVGSLRDIVNSSRFRLRMVPNGQNPGRDGWVQKCGGEKNDGDVPRCRVNPAFGKLKKEDPILMVPCASGHLTVSSGLVEEGGREGFVPERNQRNRQRLGRCLEPI